MVELEPFNMKYNYLIVDDGLFGSVFAHEAKKAGKTCLVIDKRNHIAGKYLLRGNRGYQRT